MFILALDSLPTGPKVWAPFPGALLLLVCAPAGNGAVVAAAQHLRHSLALEFRWPGVVGVLQQSGAVAFLQQ